MSDEQSRGPDLIDLADRFLACHQATTAAIKAGESAARRLVAVAGPTTVMIRDGVALVPFQDERGNGITVRRYRDLDMEAYLTRESRLLGTVDRIAHRQAVASPDHADLLVFVAECTNGATEAECRAVVEALGRSGHGAGSETIAGLAGLVCGTLEALRGVEGSRFDAERAEVPA